MKELTVKLDERLYEALLAYTDDINKPTLASEFKVTPAGAARVAIQIYLTEKGFYKE